MTHHLDNGYTVTIRRNAWELADPTGEVIACGHHTGALPDLLSAYL